MDVPLASLERKVEQIIALCETLRAENRQLRERIGALEAEKRGLMERMTTARLRLEGLIDKLPAE
ncbi:hypothetical protein [Sulfuricystis multivorans]|uniref:hypothetical protein n=1 Tax=Sulfuricystis multivorans TaxID=2211108 RepID=UPI000F816416|nr:hypothetical protein [Sulfuricystis multivorans]